MKKFSYPLLVFLFALTLNVRGDASMEAISKGDAYFDPATVDFKALLPDPPADGSVATKKEINLILQKQAARTPEEVARIKKEVHLTVDLFENVLGPWFTLKNLPATAKLLHNVDASEYPIIEAAKNYWDRLRPPMQDKRVHPPIALPANASYPSGHSAFANLNAMVLAELAPDLKSALLARGKQIGEDRVIAGVHFPSDVEAGHALAGDLFARLMASPAFRVDLAKAKAEVAAARSVRPM